MKNPNTQFAHARGTPTPSHEGNATRTNNEWKKAKRDQVDGMKKLH